MPIFEYLCKSCGGEFEKLVPRPTNELYPCPECGSEQTEKKLSAFGGILTDSSKVSCPSASACESTGTPCCGGGKCPMH
jgi:putative FmdB family regulatory protein